MKHYYLVDISFFSVYNWRINYDTIVLEYICWVRSSTKQMHIHISIHVIQTQFYLRLD